MDYEVRLQYQKEKQGGILVKKSKIYPWYFAIGALIIYSALYAARSGWYRIFLYRLVIVFHGGAFCGLENFRQILGSNESYMKYIGNTLLFTVVTTVMKDRPGSYLALALSKDIKLKNRGVMYMPSVLSILIIGLVFTSILNPKTGLLNEFLRTIGMEGLTQKWLTDPKIAFFSVMGVDVWRGTGYIMTILIVGILSISTTYYEAAGIDGAGGWKKFTKITLPLLRPTLAVTVVLNVLYGLKVFDMVYALTNGGPGHTTEVMYTAVFKQFSQGMYAVGTTISSIMFVFMVIIGFFMIRVLTGNEVKE